MEILLKSRIITALILAPIVAGAVFYLPIAWFALFFWGVAALAAYEWAGLFGARSLWQKMLFVLGFGLLAGVLFWLDVPFRKAIFEPLLLLGCLFWAGACVAVLLYPKGQGLFQHPLFLGLIGLWVVVLAWICLVVIRSQTNGELWLIWMFFLVWCADIGAYFAGRWKGRSPLAPQVSPKKSWEGVAGGVVLSGVLCGGAVMLTTHNPIFWLMVTLALVGIAVFGDLFESLVKRATGVKDSGTILPGHGGMLDRVDSILAVLPFFALLLLQFSA
ncbi:MAG: phosphatidate cytidylyltransferase [Pseudomonadota bacterium]